ncbi:MAG: alcohol dehydrogenase catalytic domain-containing protein, partial [Oscillospiraceae bacterium]|nr:alcohol dehydrogenase catalytic domain-containing protein [Oscillospiraceae bacterium]
VLEEAYRLELKEVPVPETPEGYALVKILAVSVCGSDIHAYRGNSLLLTYPRVLGHELCGIVEELNGPAEGLAEGDKVSVLPYLSCGCCTACRQERENCCTSLKVLGVHVEGGIAGYVSVPISALLKLPQDMDPKTAALIEPFAVSAHAVRRGGVTEGDRVLVLGAGPIGLGAAEAARAAGADVRMADVDPVRRAFVRERFGYEALDPAEGFDDALRAWTGGEYPNKVVDSTGNKVSNATAINYLSAAGSLVYVGLQTGTLDISDPAFHIREATVYASRVAQMRDFRYVLEQIRKGTIRAERAITDTAELDRAKEAFEDWVSRRGAVFKGVIEVK